METWRLDEWVEEFVRDKSLPPMSAQEISDAIWFLKDHYYPVPEDCPGEACTEYRPACMLKICKIAVVMAGDW